MKKRNLKSNVKEMEDTLSAQSGIFCQESARNCILAVATRSMERYSENANRSRRQKIPCAKKLALLLRKSTAAACFVLIFSCVCAYASEAETEQAAGFAWLKAGNQWEKAAPHLKAAVELDPSLYLAWYNLGMIYIDTQEGYGYFQKAVEVDPDFPTAYYWMAYCRCRNREDQLAIPLFEKYLEVAKGHKKEANRVKEAEEVLKDLLAGTEGKVLKQMRRPVGKE